MTTPDMPRVKPEGVKIDRIHTDGERNFYHISTEFGGVDSIYSPDGLYQIANFDTRVRGQGHGQNLLRHSREHAIRLGARVILSALTSREAYEAAQRVFGDESLIVAELGDFAPDEVTDDQEIRPTSVLLRHRLKNQNN